MHEFANFITDLSVIFEQCPKCKKCKYLPNLHIDNIDSSVILTHLFNTKLLIFGAALINDFID